MAATDEVEIDASWALEVEMPDGSRWRVPVEVIARNRAAHYADEFIGGVEQSLREDTLPLFRANEYEIRGWATGNMDWSDVEHAAEKVSDPPEPDYQRAWVNTPKKVVRTPHPQEGEDDTV